MRTLNKIYLHCSYSEWGSVETIRQWHLEKGWKDIGYHFVVYNQFTTYELFQKVAKATASDAGKLGDRLFSANTDGKIVTGRPIGIVGAHVLDDNDGSIGICYVGVTPTVSQYAAMLTLCKELIAKYPTLSVDRVFGHYEYWTNLGKEPEKTCPNFNVTTFRNMLKAI